MDISLNAEIRESKGKGLRNREGSEGKIPAVVYGQDIESQALFVDEKIVKKILQQYGTTQLVTLKVEDEAAYKVMIREVQNSPVKHDLLHLDFLKVDMKELLKVVVPIRLEGEPEALKQGGILQQQLWEVEVECLPDNMPEALIGDISNLALEENITVADLEEIEGVEVLMDAEQSVASIEPEREEEEEEVDVDEDVEPEVIGEEDEEEETEE